MTPSPYFFVKIRGGELFVYLDLMLILGEIRLSLLRLGLSRRVRAHHRSRNRSGRKLLWCHCLFTDYFILLCHYYLFQLT